MQFHQGYSTVPVSHFLLASLIEEMIDAIETGALSAFHIELWELFDLEPLTTESCRFLQTDGRCCAS